MNDFEENDYERQVVGGLVIKKLNRLVIDDFHYNLFKHRFDMDALQKSGVDPQVIEKAQEIKSYIDNEDPPHTTAYQKKFMSYNHMMLIHDMIQQLRFKDGPHIVTNVTDAPNPSPLRMYQVQLSMDFCERFTVPQSGVIILDPAKQENQRFPEQIKGRIVRFDEETNIVQFWPFRLGTVFPPGMPYHISFEPSRFVYNSRNMILCNLDRLDHRVNFLIFPAPFDRNISKEDYIQQRDADIGKIPFANYPFNLEQRQAVYAIYSSRKVQIRNQKHAMLPFVLHGPPGTGKTTVLVEAVRLLMAQPQSESANRILVCCPSNTAADLFATKLLETNVSPKAIFRMYALMMPIWEVNDTLKECARIYKNENGFDMFGIPPLAELSNFQVIICTIMASSYLILGKMSEQFTHIIIDEAGQASELETIVPIVGLIGDDTKVILAGDARQLGPIETLEYFRKNALAKSMIERLEGIEMYKDDPRIMTMLRQNYRSHPAIIEVPSRLFYNNELVASKDVKTRERLANWGALPKKGIPLFWHHVEGPEKRENGGTSYMNEKELNVVVDYVKRIVAELHVKESDIGVISPYTYQTRQLHHAFRNDYPDITVDSVERFQGSQRRVIIVTTVRSNADDKLGFMNSDKRFNTTITRAEELLIIVGNCKTLQKGSSWAELANYCRQHEAGIGLPPAFIVENGKMEANGTKRPAASDTESDTSDEEEETEDEEESDEDEEESGGDEEEAGEDEEEAGEDEEEAGEDEEESRGNDVKEGSADNEDKEDSDGDEEESNEDEQGSDNDDEGADNDEIMSEDED